MQDRKDVRPPIGIISLVVIFIVICLAVFAVLSLSAANTQYSGSVKMAESIQSYYAADKLCCDFANAVGELAASDSSADEIVAYAVENGAECERNSDGIVINYSSDVDNARRIDITLRVTDDVEVLSWQTVNWDEWEFDDSMEVWDVTSLGGE